MENQKVEIFTAWLGLMNYSQRIVGERLQTILLFSVLLGMCPTVVLVLGLGDW